MAALVIATGVVAFTTWSLWLADAQEARGSTMAMKALADAQKANFAARSYSFVISRCKSPNLGKHPWPAA